ncbi:hypothetical protein CLBEIC_06550 [Clostridium beijerinckii]|nr:hypothetical protein CLOBI_02000 [Clostridium beijerinckii]OOM72646.1 hypothetical protein CLBEIC_06550 [Clostridium beijerinckii]CUU48453.1 conserved protein of unknown function [Clostridium beijerinckii]
MHSSSYFIGRMGTIKCSCFMGININAEYVEWGFHEKDTALTTNQVKAKVDSYRNQGVTFKDTVD